MPAQPTRRETVLDAGAVLLPNGDDQLVKFGVSVRIRDDQIVEVGEELPTGAARRVDMSGQLLTPGFISTHSHVAGAVPTRALIESRVGNYSETLRVADQLEDEDLDAMTAFNLAELVRSGCTTQVEMSLSERQAQSYVRVAESFGVRGYPSALVPGCDRLYDLWDSSCGPPKPISDERFAEFEEGTLNEIDKYKSLALGWKQSTSDRINPMMGPHATDTHTPSTLRAVLTAARELESGIQIHLAQSTEEAQSVLRRWGLRPVEWLDQLGIFEVPVFGAHLNGADLNYDPLILANRNFTFSSCPFEGGVNGLLQPYPEMLAAGVNVGIGVDAHNMDFIETMKMAVVKGQARHKHVAFPGVPSASPTIEDVIYGATQGAADALGRHDLGRITPGAKADLVSIDVSGFFVGSGAMSPEPLSHLLYANGSHVRNVLIDGCWMVLDGEMTFADPKSLKLSGGRAAQKVWDTLTSSGWLDSPSLRPGRKG